MRARLLAVRRLLLAALALAGCSLTAAVALAQTGGKEWRPGQSLGAGINFGPEVALDQAGDATAAWERTGDAGSEVVARSRPVGGPWGDATRLEPRAVESSNVLLAAAPGGEVVAVWQAWLAVGTGDALALRTASRPRGGEWSAPTTIPAQGNG